MLTRLMIVLSLCSCSGEHRQTQGPEVEESAAEVEVSAAEVEVSADAAATRVAALIEKARLALYAAATDDEADAALATLVDDLAGDALVTDDAIAAEKQLRDDNLRSLHSGEQRVYPAPRTMKFMVGVPAALGKALRRRAESK